MENEYPQGIYPDLADLSNALFAVRALFSLGAEASEDEPLALPETPERRAALSLWGGQLALNSLWWVIFFGLRSLGWAVAETGVLWTAIAAMAVKSYRIKPVAGLLLVPYLRSNRLLEVHYDRLSLLDRRAEHADTLFDLSGR